MGTKLGQNFVRAVKVTFIHHVVILAILIADSVTSMDTMQEALEGLSRVDSKMADSGVIDVGLPAAVDVGVQEADFIQILKSSLRDVIQKESKVLKAVKTMPSGKRTNRSCSMKVSSTMVWFVAGWENRIIITN